MSGKKIYRSPKDFSDDQIQKLNDMHKVLKEYNASLGTENELPLPKYSSNEMAEYSVYRELLIANECNEH
jgi:hypothetical protein